MSENVDTWARYVGEDCPETPWLLHPCDVWVANPHYVGPPRPHPENDDADDDIYADGPFDAEMPERGQPWRTLVNDFETTWDDGDGDDIRF